MEKIHIITTKPRTDLCQENNRAIYRSANRTDAQKAAKLTEQTDHLKHVTQERQLYQLHVADAKSAVEDSDWAIGPHPPCSTNATMHYSFDYAQQVRDGLKRYSCPGGFVQIIRFINNRLQMDVTIV